MSLVSLIRSPVRFCVSSLPPTLTKIVHDVISLKRNPLLLAPHARHKKSLTWSLEEYKNFRPISNLAPLSQSHWKNNGASSTEGGGSAVTACSQLVSHPRLLVRCVGVAYELWTRCNRKPPLSCVRSMSPIDRSGNKMEIGTRNKLIVSATKRMHHCHRSPQRLKGRYQRGKRQLQIWIVPVTLSKPWSNVPENEQDAWPFLQAAVKKIFTPINPRKYKTQPALCFSSWNDWKGCVKRESEAESDLFAELLDE